MPATVRLKDIVDALEMQFDESSAFLDLDTGQVETVSHALLREAEDSGDEEPELPTWQKHEWEIAKRIVSTDRFQELPTKFEVHEWAIMQDFSRSVEFDSIRENLLNAIHGPGEFRNFRSIASLRHRAMDFSMALVFAYFVLAPAAKEQYVSYPFHGKCRVSSSTDHSCHLRQQPHGTVP